MQATAVLLLGKGKKKNKGKEKRKRKGEKKKQLKKSPFAQAKEKHFLPLVSLLPQERQSSAQRHFWLPWKGVCAGITRLLFCPKTRQCFLLMAAPEMALSLSLCSGEG